jgi:hypothetical protein
MHRIGVVWIKTKEDGSAKRREREREREREKEL